jgi:uncharacterized membrane protein YczE
MHIDWSYEFKRAQEFLRAAETAAVTYIIVAATQVNVHNLHTLADWKAALLAIAIGAAVTFVTAVRAKIAGPVATSPAATGPAGPAA